jgi:sugar phosphate permease
VTGLLMQAIGLGWIAMAAAPGTAYAAMFVAPLVLAGVGVSMAMPAAQNAILGSVGATEMGKASGIFNMARFLGGMFGIAAMVLDAAHK